ncbi:hypothetical protein, partial [Escherichia coli]|uniref:hypothetical protein n=1 Tax=Escherichia coli TaxID=562 RepID=UPI003F7735AD
HSAPESHAVHAAMHAVMHHAPLHPTVHAVMHHATLHPTVHHAPLHGRHPDLSHSVGGRDGTRHGGGRGGGLDEGGTAQRGQHGEGEGQFPHEETPNL